MSHTLTIPLLLLLLLLSSSAAQHRRLLHHPLFPTLPIPQTPAPSPLPLPKKQLHQPKLPFSSTSSSPPSPKNPFFFPSDRSPPPLPPSPTVLATFPANISSLLLPRPSVPTHRPALALALSFSLISLALLAAAAAFAFHRRTRASSNSPDHDKASRRSDSLRLYPRDAITSDGVDRNPHSSSPRSDYIYLGTVASSEPADSSSCSSNNDGFRPPPYRKLGDSPELKPLPPLPRHTFRPWLNEEEKKKKNEDEEGEEEEFFSPRGSSGNKEQSPPSPVFLAESSSRSLIPFYFEKLGSRSFTRSKSVSNSRPCSPVSSASIKSLPPQSPVSASQSPSFSSPKPREDLGSSGKDFPATTLPSPPPPPPPPRFWETPVLNKLAQNVGVGSEIEETPTKPKLKALHWDKVKASSDRATVWDRLRPSSFQ